MSQPFYKRASSAAFLGGFLLFVLGVFILLIPFRTSMAGGLGLGWGGGLMVGGFTIRRLEKQLEKASDRTMEP